MSWVSLALFVSVASVSATCNPSMTVDDAQLTASDLYSSGDYEAADACLGIALHRLTTELERLATEASNLRAYRAARRLNPRDGDATGCVVGADGTSLCLLGSKADADRTALIAAEARSVSECMSEAEANTLLARVERGEVELPTTTLDAGIVQAAQRHWWNAARAAVNLLRSSSTAVSSETRRVVTELRDVRLPHSEPLHRSHNNEALTLATYTPDPRRTEPSFGPRTHLVVDSSSLDQVALQEAGSVLNLMRQTKMDEATIHCACLWAQGGSLSAADRAA